MKQILCIALAVLLTVSAFAFTSAAVTLIWPVPGHTNLSQGYHDGAAIDISDGSIAGATVVAALGGTVKYKFTCGQQHYGSMGDCNGFGTGVVILGDDGRWYQYAHMQANSIPSNVNVGAYVSAGQTIGKVGTTGNSSGNHLHFGISTGNYWSQSGINPQNETYSYNSNPNPTNPFTGTYAEEITGTNAKLRASLNLTYVSQCGLYFGTSASNMTKRNTENVYAKINNIHYYMNGDFAICLKHQTTYYYKFYVIIDGVEIQSATNSFNSGGTHSWSSGTVTQSATCISTGSKRCTCYCGATKNETIPVNASNHVHTTNVAATNSTCTVKGYTAGVYCNDCKKYISGHAELPLADHSDPDANGNCSVCGQHIKDVTPTQPDNPQPQQDSGCKWCGGTHDGFFGAIVGFFHRILAALFGARY